MTDRNALPWLGLAALLLVPGAAAFGVDPAGALAAAPPLAEGTTLPGTSPLVDATPLIDDAPAIADATNVIGDAAALLPVAGVDPLAISVNAQVSANADVALTTGNSPALPADAGAAQPSAAAQLMEVAAPAAGFSFLAVLAAALALGSEGLRALQGRVSGLFGRLGRFLGLAFLFSRIERGDLLENPVRARVHDTVAQDPGLSLSDVSTRAGIAWGTTVHHLRRLEAHGMVVSVSRLAHRRYFIANSPAAEQRAAVAVVMHPTARRIAHLVNQRPGIDQTGICHALALANPAASKHLSKFEAEGLIVSQRVGRGRHYHGTTSLDSALRLVEASPPQLSDHPTLRPAPVAGAC